MDLFDLFALLPLPLPGASSRDRSPGEGITGALALTVFPAADFAIVLFGDVWTGLAVPMLVLPAAFTAASVFLTRLVGTSVAWTVTLAIGCGVFCALASGFALILAVFGSFYSGF